MAEGNGFYVLGAFYSDQDHHGAFDVFRGQAEFESQRFRRSIHKGRTKTMTTVDSRIKTIKGKAVAVPGDDIDTDRIMPARYLRCVTFADIGQYTFQDERFTPEGKQKEHPFNDPKYRDAKVLLVNKNFGCGSSREHAPQG